MKICTKCKVDKSLPEFSKDKSKPDGHHSHCKECQRIRSKGYYSDPKMREARRKRSKKWAEENPERARLGVLNATLKKKYGITLEDYQALFTKQNGCCAICGTTQSAWGKLAVDHNHDSGEVRGLLCFNCNTSIGKLNDDPALLRRAAEYLEESSRSLR